MKFVFTIFCLLLVDRVQIIVYCYLHVADIYQGAP